MRERREREERGKRSQGANLNLTLKRRKAHFVGLDSRAVIIEQRQYCPAMHSYDYRTTCICIQMVDMDIVSI